jgi:uncharacterized protein YidB (DUF937 family)
MSILDTILAALNNNANSDDNAENPLGAALNSMLAQNGGMQGLMEKFSQGGLGEVFSSWVGTGDNQAVSSDQISNLLGSDQQQSLASSLGVDADSASGFLADYLPKIIDQLTPSGEVAADGDSSQNLAALLPSLLSNLGDESSQA